MQRCKKNIKNPPKNCVRERERYNFFCEEIKLCKEWKKRMTNL